MQCTFRALALERCFSLNAFCVDGQFAVVR